jgi:hypothetical protein
LKYLTYILFLLSLSANCQFKNYAKENTVWYVGSIHHEDGSVYNGKLNYNFISDIIKIQINDGDEQIFTANSTLYFQFVVGSDTVKYFSLPYDSKGAGHSRLSFYKVEYERRHDIIVSKNMFEHKENSYSNYNGNAPPNAPPNFQHNSQALIIGRENVERVTFINSKGKMHPVLNGKVDKDLDYYYTIGVPDKKIEKQILKINLADTVILASSMEAKKYKLTDKNFIQSIYPDYNSELSKFVKSNKLKFKSIGDLITVIDKKYQLEKIANRD